MGPPNTNIIAFSAVRFINEPFARSLTATAVFLSANRGPDPSLATVTRYVTAPASYLLSWEFDDSIALATRIDGTPYFSNTVLSANQVGTLILDLTAGTPVTIPFTLITPTAKVNYLSSVGDSLPTTFDTYKIDYSISQGPPNTSIIAISSIDFDNEPFIRSLTATAVFLSANNLDLSLATRATYVSAPASYLLSWTFDDSTVWAKQLNGTPYTSNTDITAGQISTLVFYVTAGTYNHIIAPYTLLTQTIEAYYKSSVDLSFGQPISFNSFNIIYDLFPSTLIPTLCLNYENTNFSPLFYREVSNTPYNFNFATVISEDFLNKINYILKSQNFDFTPTWTSNNLQLYPNLYPAPDNTQTATLLIPVTGLPYNTIKTVGNLQNDLFPRNNGERSASDSQFTVASEGYGAKFLININNNIVTSVVIDPSNPNNGGQNYNPNDIIKIDNSVFPGTSSTDPALTFSVLELDNISHDIQQSISLSPGRYRFSLYAYPSADGRYLYFSTSEHGDIIFDLYGANTFNYGIWEPGSGAVIATNPSEFNLSGYDFENRWVRCTAILNITAANTFVFDIGVTSTTDSINSDAGNTDAILIWGAQIEPGTTTTTYTSTDTTAFNKKYNVTTLSLNNGLIPTNVLDVNTTVYTDVCIFNGFIPSVSSIQISVSSGTTFNSLTSWYTPHIFTNSISAKFIPQLLSADFVGWPSVYFDASGTGIPVFPPDNYTVTNGLCFYGEGHTETITFSAPTYPNNPKHFWTFYDINTNVYEKDIGIGVAGTTNPLITSLSRELIVNVPTFIGYYPSIPVSLYVTNDYILSSGPIYKLNDTTGDIEPYPFFYSTVLITSGTQVVEPYTNPNNNKFKKNIQVVNFAPVLTSFSTDVAGDIFLPVGIGRSGTQILSADLLVALYGGGIQSIDRCYDKYNILWKWSALSAYSANPSSFTNKPSSWADAQCTQGAGKQSGPLAPPPPLPVAASQGRFPKKWVFEGFNANDGIVEPEFCTSTGTVWTLSTSKWSINTALPVTEKKYEFPISYLGNGTNFYTASITENTNIFIQGQQVATCTISAFPFDWGAKSTVAVNSSIARILSRGDFRFYTSNRFVLTGQKISFQNLSVGFNNVNNIVIDFENNTPITLLGNNIYNNFETIYTEPGYKTITVTINYNNGGTIIEKYKNILNIVAEYDTVDPENYRTPKSELVLPWPNKPHIAPNEWVTENNINSVIRKFYENLEYLETRSRNYYDDPVEFYGWLGTPPPPPGAFVCPVWAWEDVECLTPVTSSVSASQYVTWEDVECLDTNITAITANGRLAQCAPWELHLRKSSTTSSYNPDCFGRHCIEWKWKSRRSNNITNLVQWSKTKFGEIYEKRWYSEPCITLEGDVITGLNCNDGFWQVNIPKINENFNPIGQCTDNPVCSYRNIATYNDLIVVALPTQIKVLSSEYDPSFIASKRTIDDFFAFKDIKNIEFDSNGRFFVLDGTLNRVVAYDFDITQTTPWVKILDWGGFGSSNSRNKYSSPNDIHIDNLNNIWIADTGNSCIKHYTNTGTWIQTIKSPEFTDNTPTSIVVDSQNQVHALVNNKIIVFSYIGNYLFEYTLNEFSNTTSLRLSVNQNRELIYVVSAKKVGKYFRNGAFAGFIVQDKACAQNITSVHQDQYRNVLITSGEKILKYVDPMRTKQLKGPLPSNYWKLRDILIHKDEYVQDWVYNKAFQRIWDNIELFRRSLIFELNNCQKYIPPTHSKDKISIGQNEIVTAASVNRIIGYLWENLSSIIAYFDPVCLFTILEQQEQQEQQIRQVTLTFAGTPGTLQIITPT